MSYDILDRMERAVEKVRERCHRSTTALERIGVPYAVIGRIAAASWVAAVDEGAVRNSRDVEILIRECDLAAITAAFVEVGFARIENVSTGAAFRDQDQVKPSGLVRLFADDSPGDNVVDPAGFRVLAIEPLVRRFLTRNRNEDGMLMRDLTGVGLVDATWLGKFPPPLDERLKLILDTPDG